MGPYASGTRLRAESSRRSAGAWGQSAGWLLLQMDRALRVWTITGACVCGTGKPEKRPRQLKAARGLSTRSFFLLMGPPWPRVAAKRWSIYGTWLLLADAV